MIRIFSVVFSLFFFVTSGAFAQKADVVKELSPEEVTQIEKGELILKTKDVEGSAWPEITLYSFIPNVSALESMGIFSALDYQKDYVPNVIKSKPIKHVSAVEVLTDYEMHVPFPLSNAHYVHGSVVHQYSDDEYELTWYKVTSTSTEEVKGSAYFSNIKLKENSGSLFRYRSYIKPKSVLGSLVKKIMLRDVKNSILSIRSHIEKLKKENSTLISKYSGFITRSLKGEFVYKTIIESE
jgi:hypothetical protein